MNQYHLDFRQFINEQQNQQNVDAGLDALKLALDVWGFEPTTGWIGDLASGGISLAQAIQKAVSKKPGAGKHLIDAGISLVSTIPFADVVKLIKLRHGPKYASLALKFARPIKSSAQQNKIKMVQQRTTSVATPNQQQTNR